MQSLRAQGKGKEAAVIEARYRKEWERADVALTASRFMGDGSPELAAVGTALPGNRGGVDR